MSILQIFICLLPMAASSGKVRKWLEIGPKKICDTDLGEIYIPNSPGKVSSLEQCKQLCEAAGACQSITYFKSTWCSHFSTPCTKTKRDNKAATAQRLSAGDSSMMRIDNQYSAQVVHPYGEDDPRTATRPFPQDHQPDAFTDPFLAFFTNALPSPGISTDPDIFPLGWHSHRGHETVTYLKTGVGRHADSMGQRITYETPGMQWMCAGSGLQHAEQGATPEGVAEETFQIWVNLPPENKMDEPRFGTTPNMPQIDVAEGVKARVLTGYLGDHTGDWVTIQPAQIVDYELAPGAVLDHVVPDHMDTAMLFVYEGTGRTFESALATKDVVVYDASDPDRRVMRIMAAKDSKAYAIVMTGKKLHKPSFRYYGIVMNTEAEVDEAKQELAQGKFPPKRVPYDYKSFATFPKEL